MKDLYSALHNSVLTPDITGLPKGAVWKEPAVSTEPSTTQVERYPSTLIAARREY
jgi:hypothetical protein